MMLTGRQIREGRIFAGLSQDDLAAIRGALEAAGVEFIPENVGGACVRLRDRKTPAEPHE